METLKIHVSEIISVFDFIGSFVLKGIRAVKKIKPIVQKIVSQIINKVNGLRAPPQEMLFRRVFKKKALQ